MGQRANLIVIENNELELYYDHWCANELDAVLFWGVDESIKFFRDHDKKGDEWWLDTVWCEGGAVIDLDKNILLWFGGEDIIYDISLRKLLLELMQTNWPGFRIVWAFEGIADLAAYAGYDINKVIASKNAFSTDKILSVFNPDEEINYRDCAISIRNLNNEIEIYTTYLDVSLEEFLLFGSGMVSIKRGAKYYSEYIDNPESDNALHSGIHIDPNKKEIHIWSCFEVVVVHHDRLRKAWDGYKLFYHKDDYEIHTKLTDGKLRFVQRERNVLIHELKQIVCKEFRDPFNTVNTVINALTEQNKKVEVSAAVFMASKYETNPVLREKMFDRLFIE